MFIICKNLFVNNFLDKLIWLNSFPIYKIYNKDELIKNKISKVFVFDLIYIWNMKRTNGALLYTKNDIREHILFIINNWKQQPSFYQKRVICTVNVNNRAVS